MTETRLIALSAIDDGGRLAKVRPAHVTAMAEVIAAEGLLQPIRVVETQTGFRLVFGATRLAAVKSLGQAEIRAEVQPAHWATTDANLRIQGIVENFARFPLTALERAIRLCEWKDLYEAAHPGVRHGGARAKTMTSEQDVKMTFCFSDEAAETLDVSKSVIERSVRIARDIVPELQERLRHHSVADRQSELLLLAAQTKPRQALIVELLTKDVPEAHSVTDAIAILDGTVQVDLSPAQKFAARFGTLPEKEREAFYALRASEIERWYVARLHGAKKRAA